MKKSLLYLLLVIHFSLLVIHCSAQWQQTNGPGGGDFYCIAVSGSDIFAGSYDSGLYISKDDGVRWAPINNGLPFNVRSILADGKNIFVGNSYGVYLSTDGGMSWTSKSNGLYGVNVCALAVNGTNIYAGEFMGGVFISSDNGEKWTSINNGLKDSNVVSIATNGTNIFAGTDGGGVFLSTDNGKNWKEINNNLTDIDVWSLAIKDTYIYAGTDDGLFISTNNGSSWYKSDTGLPINIHVNSIIIYNSTVYLGSVKGIFRSTNNGLNWNELNKCLANINIRSLVIKDRNLYAATESDGIVLVNLDDTICKPVNSGLTNTDIRAITINNDKIIASAYGAGVFLSSNNGDLWTSIKNNLPCNCIDIFARDGENIYAGTNIGIFLTTDNGSNWIYKSDGTNDRNIWSLAVNGSKIYAGSDYEKIYFSSNNGLNWKTVHSYSISYGIDALVFKDENIYAGTNSGVFLSTNDGVSWTLLNKGFPTDIFINNLVINGNNIYAGSYEHGLFLSTDNGSNWSNLIQSSYNIYSLAVLGKNIFISSLLGVNLSTDNGRSWKNVSDGLTDDVISFAISNKYLFAGTYSSGVWRRPLSEMVGIDELRIKNEELGIKVYPNPVGEITNIKYQIPEKSKIQINIYNILGKPVKTIVNEVKEKGEYSISYDVSGLSSGIYFVELKTNDRIAVAKFIKE